MGFLFPQPQLPQMPTLPPLPEIPTPEPLDLESIRKEAEADVSDDSLRRRRGTFKSGNPTILGGSTDEGGTRTKTLLGE